MTFRLTNEDRKLLKPTETTPEKRRMIVHISNEGASPKKNGVGMKEPNANRSGRQEGSRLGGKDAEMIVPAPTEYRGVTDATGAAVDVGEGRLRVHRRATLTMNGNAGTMMVVDTGIIEKRDGQSEKRSDQRVVTGKRNQRVASVLKK